MRAGTVGKSFYLFMEGVLANIKTPSNVLANIIHSVHSLEESLNLNSGILESTVS